MPAFDYRRRQWRDFLCISIDTAIRVRRRRQSTTPCTIVRDHRFQPWLKLVVVNKVSYEPSRIIEGPDNLVLLLHPLYLDVRPFLSFPDVRDHRFQPKNDHRFQPVQMSSNSTNIQNAVDSIFVSLSYLRQYGSVAEVHLSDYLVLSSVRLACKVEAIGSVEKTVQYALRKN